MKGYKGIKAIAFDFWGVLATIDPPINHYLKGQGILTRHQSKQIHRLIVAHDLGKISEKQFLKECSMLVGINLPYSQYRYTYKPGSLNDHLIDIIKRLKRNYLIALLSNNNKEYVREYIRKTGIFKLFDLEVISYKVGYRKPDIRIYKTLVRKLQIKPYQILFVDDDPNKLQPAKAIGFRTMRYAGKRTDKMLSYLAEID